ncbi:hypothetical protein M2360_003084 [Rhizobium sp. SG_E_25_P2]|uniref:sulfotransferase family 2 domain-containing protein n=1 Tax=Rhizobium sp. SG_E_25_P2 TaxID=2879942 RepID=UPI002475C38D|nr:sulfotransferase family 2 domain-containing protein [Rhizobium sp. SG_E_25_P2]MDH6267687.1 hypothetical protein [Rhizobium sp. SG_E_25_P2]
MTGHDDEEAMIEYEKFIYLDMYKTGSSYVVALLNRLVAGKPVRAFRHAPLTKGRPFFWKQGKYAFATVRNPWDWYVSMWSYSIEQPNVVFFRDVRKSLGEDGVNRLFDRSNPKESFRLWLRSVNDPSFFKTIETENPYAHSSVNPFLGFYSYRFLRVTTPHPALALNRAYLWNMDRAIAHQKRWAIYDHVFKSETLTQDFSTFVLENIDRCGFKKNAEAILRKHAPQPKNTSTRTLTTYRDYYDDELRDLVARRDRLMIDLFGYEF